MNTPNILGEAGIKAAIEAVSNHMTYELTLALMVEIAADMEEYPDPKTTRLDSILWSVRYAYITGYCNALETYEAAISGDESRLTSRGANMSEEEFCENVRRIHGFLGLYGEDLRPAPPKAQIMDEVRSDDLRLSMVQTLAGMTTAQLDKAIELMNAKEALDFAKRVNALPEKKRIIFNKIFDSLISSEVQT